MLADDVARARRALDYGSSDCLGQWNALPQLDLGQVQSYEQRLDVDSFRQLRAPACARASAKVAFRCLGKAQLSRLLLVAVGARIYENRVLLSALVYYQFIVSGVAP